MDQNFFSQNPAFQNISPEKLAFLMNFMNQGKAKFFQRYDGFSYEFCRKSQKSESLVYHRRNRFYYPASAPGTKSRGTAKNRSSAANAAEEKIIPPVILHTILCAILLIISSYMQKD